MSSLLDGLARQRDQEAETVDQEGGAEGRLLNSFFAVQLEYPFVIYPTNKKKVDENLPRSFAEACRIPLWCDAIYRDYNAHVRRGTWRYIRGTPDMRPVPFIWGFRKKPLDNVEILFLFKARRCLRGDRQLEFFDFDPDFVYAAVTAYESIRKLSAFAAARGLSLERADISNIYLYDILDILVVMEPPTNSNQDGAKPGYNRHFA